VATDLAARGIHVEEIAHVINYDLPDVAENFIHRVGRTGRAGKHGIASTLFSKEQRSEIYQIERALGIRMERLQADNQRGEKKDRIPDTTGRKHVPHHTGQHSSDRTTDRTAQRSTMVALPGEVLQVRMEV
jgi:ATP-dependent RNA helicase RhlE